DVDRPVGLEREGSGPVRDQYLAALLDPDLGRHDARGAAGVDADFTFARLGRALRILVPSDLPRAGAARVLDSSNVTGEGDCVDAWVGEVPSAQGIPAAPVDLHLRCLRPAHGLPRKRQHVRKEAHGLRLLPGEAIRNGPVETPGES